MERKYVRDISELFKIEYVIYENRAFRAERAGGGPVFLKRWGKGDPAAVEEAENLVAAGGTVTPEFYETVETDEGVYVSEEWIEGVTLEEYIKENGPADDGTAAEMILAICGALFQLHRKENGSVAVLDLKPSNIMLREAAGGCVVQSGDACFDVCLLDLETAAAEGKQKDKADGGDAGKTRKLGSLYYTAPEVLFGKESIRSDIYGLGVVFAFILTGEEKYPAAYKLRKPFEGIIRKCTAAEPGKRYAGTGALADAVREAKLGLEAEETADSQKKRRRKAAEAILRHSEGKHPPAKKAALKREETTFKPIFECFRRSCVAVFENPCFASELAVVASRSAGLRTGVFVLSERARKNIEYYFTGERRMPSLAAEGNIYPYVFDHKSLYYHFAEDWEARGLLVRDSGNLFRGTFKMGLELPFRTGEDLKKFCDWCYGNFDLFIFSAEKSDPEELTFELRKNADFIVATPDANIEDIESDADYFAALAEEGRVLLSKVRYVAWNHDEGELSSEQIINIVGKNRFLGAVGKSETYRKKKNRTAEADSFTAEPETAGQYEEILKRLIG